MFSNVVFIPEGLMAFFFFVFGSFFGSFANVLIYRMQEQKNPDLLKPSHCLHCQYNIPFYLNIPVFSWFFLRGRCKNCNKPFSFRYCFVEFLTAVLFMALFLSIGWKWFLLEALIFSFTLVVASCIDLDKMILPDSLTLSGIIIGLFSSWINPERFFLDALLGCFFGGIFFIFVGYIYYFFRGKEAIGGGDVKMMAWIGSILGWDALFFVIFMSSFLGSLFGFGMGLMYKNKKIMETPLPFGPYLAVGSLIYIFLYYQSPSYLNFFNFSILYFN